MRSKLDRACQGIEDLAAKGPMRPEELRGLDNLDDYVKAEDITVINGLKKMPPKTGVREVQDEHKYRTGWLFFCCFLSNKKPGGLSACSMIPKHS